MTNWKGAIAALASSMESDRQRLAALRERLNDPAYKPEYASREIATLRASFAEQARADAASHWQALQRDYDKQETALAQLRTRADAALDWQRVAGLTLEVRGAASMPGQVSPLQRLERAHAEAVRAGDFHRTRAIAAVASEYVAPAIRDRNHPDHLRASELRGAIEQAQRAEFGPEAPQIEGEMATIKQAGGELVRAVDVHQRELDPDSYRDALMGGGGKWSDVQYGAATTSGGGAFDADAARANGGGVVWGGERVAAGDPA